MSDIKEERYQILRPAADDVVDLAACRCNLTDLGNAERFMIRFGQDFRFCAELGWFAWDGKRWHLLSAPLKKMPAKVAQAINETVRCIKNEAKMIRASGIIDPVDERWTDGQKAEHAKAQQGRMDFWIQTSEKKKTLFSDKVAEWARSSEGNGRLKAIAALIDSFPGIVADVEDFDADRMAINCQNGTLRIEMLREKRPAHEVAAGKSEWRSVWGIKKYPHNRADLITKITQANYKPNAASPIFDNFLSMIQPDPVMRRFILQWAGLSMTGDISEQKFAFFYGQGANGKGTFVEALAYIAGDYAGSTPVETLLDNGKKRSGSEPTPDIASLPGIRFLRVSEPSKGAKLNEGLIKMLTGGDPVKARHLEKSMFTFLPSFKATISGNIKPVVADTTDGIWRRMMLVPFEVQVPAEQRDRGLTAKLQSEADGIFSAVMRGLIDWRVNGLIEPDTVKLATSEYRDDSDDMGRFLRQCCKIGEDLPGRQMRIRTSDLFAIYTAWAAASGAYDRNNKQFTNAMRDKGFKTKTSNGNYWLGVIPVVEAQDIIDGKWTAADEKSTAGDASAAPDIADDGAEYEWEKS